MFSSHRRAHRRVNWFLAGCLLAITTGDAAQANGRFPRAERLIERADDPSQLVLSATYGLLLTKDRGQNWYYLCEKGFSLQDNYLGDPLVSWTGSGDMLVGVQASLNRSHSEACGFDMTLGGQPGQLVVDYALDAAQVIALVTTFANGTTTHSLYRSTDEGVRFAAIGMPLPLDIAMTVDLDPSDPNRIYASGVAAGAGVFLVSTDLGANWVSHPIPGTSADEPPYIALVDQHDASRIFVRSDAWPLVEDNQMGNDALFLSRDGGETWSEAFRASAKLLGVALSPGSDTLLLGYGDPRTDPFVVDENAMGIYVGSTGTGMTDFTKQYDGSITCLSWTPSGIYACTAQAQRGFALGFLSNLDDLAGGAGFKPLLRLPEVRGPLPCCGLPASLLCGPVWPNACTIFAACGDGGASGASGCTVDAAAAPDGSIGYDAAADAPAPVADAVAEKPRSESSSGCACDLGRATRQGNCAPLCLLLTALGIAGSRRRKRRPPSGTAPL